MSMVLGLTLTGLLPVGPRGGILQYAAANIVSEEECPRVDHSVDVCVIDEYAGTCWVSWIVEQSLISLNSNVLCGNSDAKLDQFIGFVNFCSICDY